MNIKIILLVLSIGISSFIGKTMYDAGEFKNIHSHFDGRCSSVYGLNGPEDITILDNGIALISADDRWKTLAGIPVQGKIFSFDLNDPQPRLLNMTQDLGFEFHPHGISTYKNRDGVIRLFAVNHTSNGNTIETFVFKDHSLIHLETISDPLLISPNDLVLLDEDRFYVTNDHGARTSFGKMSEEYLQLSLGNILFYDGEKFHIAMEGLSYPNGINKSLSGDTIYVSESIDKTVSIYSRNSENNRLILEKEIYLDSGLDNIEIDKKGNLWIGSHPKALAFLRHAKDPEELSPSQVIRLSIKDNGHHISKEIYLNMGDELSGSSVASVYNNLLMIGAVFEDHFLLCHLVE